jgi:hypothetical protein
MKKTAIFVEGQTELIFVREYLLKWFQWTDIDLACYNLLRMSETAMQPTEYAFPNPSASQHFQVINVGGDNNVLSRMLMREAWLRNLGYSRIIGLRDIYSDAYRKASRGKVIQEVINQRFIEGARKTIEEKSDHPQDMHLCWAIMETEAWLLGLHACFERMDASLTPAHIETELGINLTDDPETTYFHPANQVKQIFSLVGKGYDKSKGDINALMGHLDRPDFEALLGGPTCNSFQTFHQAWQ